MARKHLKIVRQDVHNVVFSQGELHPVCRGTEAGRCVKGGGGKKTHRTNTEKNTQDTETEKERRGEKEKEKKRRIEKEKERECKKRKTENGD